MDIWIGIDGGNKGALVAIDANRKVVECVEMPTLNIGKGRKNKIVYDEATIFALLTAWQREHTVQLVVLEKAQAMSKQGVSSTFKTGHDYGFMKGMLVALRLPFEIIRSQDWMKIVLKGVAGEGKQRSILKASRLFPDLDMMPGRKRVPQDGIADAACMAYHAHTRQPPRARRMPPPPPLPAIGGVN